MEVVLLLLGIAFCAFLAVAKQPLIQTAVVGAWALLLAACLVDPLRWLFRWLVGLLGAGL
jgi:hypothetical protein